MKPKIKKFIPLICASLALAACAAALVLFAVKTNNEVEHVLSDSPKDVAVVDDSGNSTTVQDGTDSGAAKTDGGSTNTTTGNDSAKGQTGASNTGSTGNTGKTNTGTSTGGKTSGTTAGGSTSGGSTNTGGSTSGGSTGGGSTTPTTPVVTDPNDALRKSMESTYGVTIKYGTELGDYSPGGGGYTPITDTTKIREMLNAIKAEMVKYPAGFFKDFGDMKLTINLVEAVPGNWFAGLTEHEFYTDIKITLVDMSFLGYTFDHEMMHYIDCYLDIKTYPNNQFDAYTAINPADFKYGTTDDRYVLSKNDYNYAQTYFASEYGQTNVREDRAEVFKYMIGRAYKPTGWFDNTPLKAKASVIRQQLIDYFPSVKPGVTYYWDNIIN